jgi:hypothetical protein
MQQQLLTAAWLQGEALESTLSKAVALEVLTRFPNHAEKVGWRQG